MQTIPSICKQAASDCGSRKCSITCDSRDDSENEVSERSYVDLCRNRYCFAGSSSCSGKNKLWCKAFPYGNSAIRSNQNYLCIFYGIASQYEGGFPKSRTGHSCCGDSCRNSGSFQRSGKCRNLFCYLSCADLCCNQKSGIYVSGTWRRLCRSCDCIPSFWTCPPASQRMERSNGGLSE